MNSNKQKQGSGLIFLVILAVGLFYLFGREQEDISKFAGVGGGPDINLDEQLSLENEAQKQTEKPKTKEDAKTSETEAKPPKLLVLKNNGASKQLVVIEGGKEQVVFTDKDEKQKILSVMGTDGAGFAYALVGDSYDSMQGSIAKIATDKSGKLTIIDDEGYLGSPNVSYDGKFFLITRFDNSERNFGFHLVKKSTNSLETAIDHDPKSIGSPTFSKGGKVAYTKGQAGDSEVKLMVATADTGQTQFTFSKDDVVTSLAWMGEDKVLIALEKLDRNANNQGVVKVFNLNTKKLEDFIDATGKERFLKTSNDWVAMIAGTIADGADLSGNVVILNQKNKKQQTLVKAEAIVGWLN